MVVFIQLTLVLNYLVFSLKSEYFLSVKPKLSDERAFKMAGDVKICLKNHELLTLNDLKAVVKCTMCRR